MDTIRVFASNTLELAKRIRQAVGDGSATGPESGSQSHTSLTHLTSLRHELVGSMTRGLITVPDDSVVTVSSPSPNVGHQQPLAIPEQMPVQESMPEGIGYIQDRLAERF